jgi:hypothetical protein
VAKGMPQIGSNHKQIQQLFCIFGQQIVECGAVRVAEFEAGSN